MDGRISEFSQVASVRRYALTEGRSAGLEVLDCDNGKLRFLLNASKALDMMQLYHEGQNMSFVSKNGFTKREIGFLNRFEGGMIYTCGLDSIGGREGYELHGTLHNTPAELISVKCDECGIAIEAVVRDTALFGKNLVLRRKITSEVGSDEVTLEDTLTNEGYGDAEYCTLYHVNVGYPMLDEGARIEADICECIPRTPFAEKERGKHLDITAPTPLAEETCYFLKLKKPEISLVNEKIGKRFTLSYSNDTLPEFVEWKSMASGDYALGLEPATSKLDGGFAYKSLAEGESVKHALKLKVTKI